jgi:hypothetical protein
MDQYSELPKVLEGVADSAPGQPFLAYRGVGDALRVGGVVFSRSLLLERAHEGLRPARIREHAHEAHEGIGGEGFARYLEILADAVERARHDAGDCAPDPAGCRVCIRELTRAAGKLLEVESTCVMRSRAQGETGMAGRFTELRMTLRHFDNAARLEWDAAEEVPSDG